MPDTLLHDPVPDGRTGPFLRARHLTGKPYGGYSFDPRCARCVSDQDQEEADAAVAEVIAAVLKRGYGAVVMPWLGGWQVIPVSGSDRPWWETREPEFIP